MVAPFAVTLRSYVYYFICLFCYLLFIRTQPKDTITNTMQQVPGQCSWHEQGKCEKESNKTEIYKISKYDGAKVTLKIDRPYHLACAVTHAGT